MMPKVNYTIPVAFEDLLKPFRFKVYASGRGAAKSWSFASLLIMYALENENSLICCCREVQKSIANSVHRLLIRRINDIGVSRYFKIYKHSIECLRTGSEFIFIGLRDEHAADNIKSLEAVNICWVEEAHTLSKNSLDILIPTIREPGSEIWFSLNPRFKTDAVYKMFFDGKEQAPPDSAIKMVSWRDNMYFGKELAKHRLYDKQFAEARYNHIWEGALQSTSGNIIKRNWFRRWKPEERVDYDMMFITADTAFSKRTSADFSVLELWGMSETRMDLLDVRRGRWTYPELLSETKAFFAYHDNESNANAPFKAEMGALVIETKASGYSLFQSLADEGYDVDGFDPGDDDKVRRVYMATPFIQRGYVRVPPDGYDVWVEDFIAECTAFSPSGKHAYDDQVDAMTCAVQIWRNTYYDHEVPADE